MTNHLGMFGCGSLCKHTFTDQALAYILSDDKEHLADLFGAHGVRASPSFFATSHVGRQ
jgi:hypothetical protein